MDFSKYAVYWVVVTVVLGIIAYLVKALAPTHTLWPFGIAFFYIGVLILLTAKLLKTK